MGRISDDDDDDDDDGGGGGEGLASKGVIMHGYIMRGVQERKRGMDEHGHHELRSLKSRQSKLEVSLPLILLPPPAHKQIIGTFKIAIGTKIE